METDDTARWVRAATAGDRDAFAWLVERFYEPAFGIAVARSTDWSVAEDLTQEAFLVALTHLKRLRTSEKFGPWLFTIVRNLCHQWHRSKRYRERLALGLTKRDDSTGSPNAADAIENEERWNALGKGIETLPPKVREAIVLYYLRGQSTLEVAQTLGISAQSVRARLYRGRNQLRTWSEANAREWIVSDTNRKKTILKGIALGPIMPNTASAILPGPFRQWTLKADRPGNVARPLATKGVLAGFAVTGGIALVFVVAWQAGHSRPKAEPVTTAEPSISTATVSQETFDDDEASSRQESSKIARPIQAVVPAVAATPHEIEPGLIEDPNEYASISGHVVDGNGNPLLGAQIIVVASGYDEDEASLKDSWALHANRIDSAHHFQTTANGAGYYEVNDIAYEGTVVVYASLSGYGTSSPTFTELSDGRVIPSSPDTPRTLIRRQRSTINLTAGDRITDATIVLRPGRTLRGRVVAEDGLGVPGAVVYCMGPTSNRFGSSRSMRAGLTYTDKRGYFELGYYDALWSVTSLQVSSTEHGVHSFTSIPFGDSPVELRLQPRARLSGIILRENSRPASGYSVRIEGGVMLGEDGRQYRGGHIGLSYVGLIDEEGEYQIDAIDTGQSYRVHVVFQSGEAATVPEPLEAMEANASARWDATVFDPIIIRGQVLGETYGRPATKVHVRTSKWTETERGTTWGFGAENTVTDETGRFEIHGLKGPGKYRFSTNLEFSASLFPGERDSFSVEVTIDSGQSVDLTLRYYDQYAMSVEVVDDSGTPLNAVRVKTFHATARDRSVHGPAGETNAHGLYRYEGFVAGVPGWFEINAPNIYGMHKTEPISGEAGIDIGPIKVVLYEITKMTARILDPDGNPLANTDLLVTPQLGPAATRLSAGRHTDDLGQWYGSVPATSVAVQIKATVGDEELIWTSEVIDWQKDSVTDLGDVQLQPPPGT